MTYVNNRKYIAEAWIENRNDEEFKKSFLKALLQQWSGHEKGFDADMVDGQHFSDIERLIQESVEGLIREFYIGEQKFTASKSGEDQKYYLGFDAIKFFLEEEDGVANYSGEKKLPWEDEPRTENLTLYQVFQSLYAYTKSKYESIQSKLEIVDVIENSVDSDGHLNADSVNGLRFFILTQDQYDELDSEVQNNIHNVFIIKELEELIAAGYGDGKYPGNPDRAPISREYKFTIMPYTDSWYNEETGELVSETANWLMYRYEGYTTNDEERAEWKPLCKTNDFIDQELLKKDVDDILKENTDYIYEAIKSFDISEEGTDFDLLNYGKENFIKGAYYNYETEDDNTSVPILSINDFSYLNLTNLYDDLKEKSDTVQTALNQYQTSNDGALSTIRTDVTTNATNIENIKTGTSGTTLVTLNNSINRLQQTINNLQTSINDITTWEERITGALHYPGTTSTGASYLTTWQQRIENQARDFDRIPVVYTKVYVNEALKLGVAYMNFYHYHTGTSEAKTQWKDPTVRYFTPAKQEKITTWNKYMNEDNLYGFTRHLENTETYIQALPKASIVFNTLDGTDTLVKLTPEGSKARIEVNSKASSAKWIHVYGHCVFRLY